MGVDVGGTFTDVVLVDAEGNIHVAKVVTTPSDPRDGVRHGVEVALERAGLTGGDIERFVHGTTLATNVLLERRGARTALAVTQGSATSCGWRASRVPARCATTCCSRRPIPRSNAS